MDLEEGFNKVDYFLKKVTGRENLPDISDHDRAELSEFFNPSSKKDIDEFVSSMDPKKRAGLKVDIREWITSIVNLKECASVLDQSGVRKEKEKQRKLSTQIAEKFKAVPEVFQGCTAWALRIVNQCYGREIGANDVDIEESDRALVKACFETAGVLLFGTICGALTVGISPTILTFGLGIGIGILAFAIYQKYQIEERAKASQAARESK